MKTFIYVMCSIFLGSVVLSAMEVPTKTKKYNAEILFAYAEEKELRLPDPQYIVTQNGQVVMSARPTMNQHGSCFEPNDSISKTFIADVTKHRVHKPDPLTSTRVLEIGCGMGLLAKEVIGSPIPRENDNFTYTGLDLSKDHLAITTREIADLPNYSQFSHQVWNPVKGKFPATTFKSSYFTHIAAIHVAHFWKPEELITSLKTMEAISAPGATIYILMGNPHTEIYGPMPSYIYKARKFFGYQHPGYVEEVPQLVDKLSNLGLVSAQVKSPEFKQQIADHYLFLTPEDLCDLVRKHTTLNIIESSINNMHQGDKKMVHTGLIARKPSLSDYA